MTGRGKSDKSQRRNNHPAAKPSDLDQFGAELRGKKIASSRGEFEDQSANR